jgi:hypothetical protein
MGPVETYAIDGIMCKHRLCAAILRENVPSPLVDGSI